MKTCPICNATLFEDMNRCYGCMYSFEEALPIEGVSADIPSKQESLKQESGMNELPVFNDELSSHSDLPPQWLIKIQCVDQKNPEHRWSVELNGDALFKLSQVKV